MKTNHSNKLPDKIYCKQQIAQSNSLKMAGHCLQNILVIIVGIVLYFNFSIFVAVLFVIIMFFIVNKYLVNEKDTVKVFEVILQRIDGKISFSFVDTEEKLLKEQLYFPLKYDSWYFVKTVESNSIFQKDKYWYHKVIYLKTSSGKEIAFSHPYEEFRDVIGWVKREYNTSEEIPNYICSDIDKLIDGIKEATKDFGNEENNG